MLHRLDRRRVGFSFRAVNNWRLPQLVMFGVDEPNKKLQHQKHVKRDRFVSLLNPQTSRNIQLVNLQFPVWICQRNICTKRAEKAPNRLWSMTPSNVLRFRVCFTLPPTIVEIETHSLLNTIDLAILHLFGHNNTTYFVLFESSSITASHEIFNTSTFSKTSARVRVRGYPTVGGIGLGEIGGSGICGIFLGL